MALWSFLSLLPPPISVLTFLLILPFGQVSVCHVICERRRNGRGGAGARASRAGGRGREISFFFPSMRAREGRA